MKKINLSLVVFSFVLMAGVLFSACKKSVDDAADPDVAGLMAFNLSPDKTVVFALSGSQLTNSPLAFNNYTGVYLPIYPGNRKVEAYDYANGDSIATRSFDFEVNKFYSAFLVGRDGAYQNVVVNDNFDSLSSGQSYIRYINGINGSSNLGVTITAGGSNVVTANAGFATVSDFVAVTPGSVSISISEGSINANRTITADQNKVYTVLLTNGATSADSAQIKYVTNGELDDASSNRTSSAGRSANVN